MGNGCQACDACRHPLGSELSRTVLCGSKAQLTRLLSERDLSFQCNGGVNSAVYDGASRCIVSGDETGEVRVWDLVTCQVRRSMGCGCPVNVVVCVPELRAIASGDADGQVTLWDTATGDARLTVNSGALPVKAMVYVPQQRALLLASGGRGVGNVIGLDAKDGEKTFKVLCEEWPLSISYVQDFDAVAVGNHKLVSVWDTSTGERLWEVQASDAPVVGVAYARDLKVVISTDERGRVVLWEASTGASRLRISCGAVGSVLAMAYAADLRAVVVAGSARAVHAYCVVSGECLHRLACGYVARSVHYSEELQAVILGQHLEGRRLSALVSPSGSSGMVRVLPLSEDSEGVAGEPAAPGWVQPA